MNKTYGNWYLDKNNNLKIIPKKDSLYKQNLIKNNIEIFTGLKIDAEKYFYGDSLMENGEEDKLLEFIINHQHSINYSTKTTAELYELLINESSKNPKYYIKNYEEREEKILDLILSLDYLKLNFDKEIIKNLINKESIKEYQIKRLYKLKKFYKEKLNINNKDLDNYFNKEKLN